MIPKVIHYCWFGRNPLPDAAVRCIESWKKYMPDYEIKEWNEDNFDINICDYVKEAYAQKKYAFVSDFARFWILYNYGGVYFDVDVEVIKSPSHIVERGNFMGLENSALPSDNKFYPNPGLGMGMEPKLPVVAEIIDYYMKQHFGSTTLTIVHHTTKVLQRYGLVVKDEIQEVAGIIIYPSDYFCPMNATTGKLTITDNTVSIHLYVASWQPKKIKLLKAVKRLLGPSVTNWLFMTKRLIVGSSKGQRLKI